MTEWEGTVEEIVFRNEENGFTVLELATADGTVTAVGCMPLAQEGERLIIRGRWREHSVYGRQAQVEQYESARPDSLADMERYLGSGLIKGVGPSTAKLIVDHFKEETFDVLMYRPHLLEKVRGIGESKAVTIAGSFREQARMREIMMELQGFDITVGQALKLYRIYGDGAVHSLRENPYRLIEDVPGIGFKTADRIARSVGIENDSGFRISAGIVYMLDYALGEGHTYLLRNHLIKLSRRLLEVPEERIEERLEALIHEEALFQDTVEDRPAVFQNRARRAEMDVADRLMRLANGQYQLDDLQLEQRLRALEEKEHTTLDETQRRAVLEALCGGVTVLTGGPGTGKTTITRFIIRLMHALDMEVELCAPTGRAAKRMTEATGFEARTIHRLLEYGRGPGMVFGRNEHTPLSSDAVIVDEVSMVDIFLMRQLLRALEEGTRLVLIGDADQLPSVGPGNVLSDIIRSGRIKVVKLERIFRQSEQSGIVVNAHRINAGEMPVLNRGEDFIFHALEDVGAIVQKVLDLCTDAATAADPLRDVQVLSPMKKGELGVINLNTQLQQRLNPPSDARAEIRLRDTVLREGDKVMQTRNNYQMEWTVQTPGKIEKGQGVFNGDIGFAVHVSTRDQTVSVLFDDERLAVYDRAQMDDLELAYCVSVHKSQGSEFPVVILPIAGGAPMLMTRNLLYTALTRARSRMHLVGRRSGVFRMVQNDKIQKRYCALWQYLKGYV
ncbi:MAG: ATP-dependent RecD-like DNA helicase [Bacillota bacterium]